MELDLTIYTAGFCEAEPGKGGAAIAVYSRIGEPLITKWGYLHTTSARMECMALIHAIRHLLRHFGKTPVNVSIFTANEDILGILYGFRDSGEQVADLVPTVTELWGNASPQGIQLEFLHAGTEADAYKAAFEAAREAALGSPVLPDNGFLQIERKWLGNSPVSLLDADAEPEVKTIHSGALLVKYIVPVHSSDPKDRKVEVHLNNGTVVTVEGNGYGGFIQTGGTLYEYRYTVDIALKFQNWLNGQDY